MMADGRWPTIGKPIDLELAEDSALKGLREKAPEWVNDTAPPTLKTTSTTHLQQKPLFN